MNIDCNNHITFLYIIILIFCTTTSYSYNTNQQQHNKGTMVKFGRHLQFYLEDDNQQTKNGEPFIVPYTDIRETIGQSQEKFTEEWQNSLSVASLDYNKRVRLLWDTIFDGLFRLSGRDAEQANRGLPPKQAIWLYVSTLDETLSRDLFSSMKKIHSSASINVEALRKLVKKFDKRAVNRGDDMLTSTLLPDLYGSPIMGYPSLEEHIETLRDALIVSDGTDTEIDDDSIIRSIRREYKVSQNRQTKDNLDVKRRADELSWLRDMMANIPSSMIPRLVAHRGFHCPRDNSGKRPLENSLSACETAWSNGIHLVEVDIALTADGQLVLAHDEDFQRLALHPSHTTSKTKVSDLTYREIIGLTTKSGSRPPLLLDVLRSAAAIGGDARLVIEVKPGNEESSSALVHLFSRHPTLIDRCAVIMSFDAYTMHKLKAGLNQLEESLKTERDILHRTDSPDIVMNYDDLGVQLPSVPSVRSVSIPLQIKMPDIMLLTVAQDPQDHYELYVSVSDFSPVHSWLRHEDKPSLDGVYLQYQPEMLHSGINALRSLSKQYQVGVWGYYGDPDDIITATRLVRDCGISFVNSDLPRSFVKDDHKYKFPLL